MSEYMSDDYKWTVDYLKAGGRGQMTNGQRWIPGVIDAVTTDRTGHGVVLVEFITESGGWIKIRKGQRASLRVEVKPPERRLF